MTDDKKKHQDVADDQAQQAQPAGDQQQAPGSRVVAEVTIKAHLPGHESSAHDVISAVADQEPEAIGDLTEFVSRIEINKLIANLYSELHDIIDELKTLEPYLATEFQKKEYAGKTFAELAEKNEDGITLFTQIIQAARKSYNTDKNKTIRTVARAGEVQRITRNRLAIPTVEDYVNAISLYENGQAHLSIMKMDGLTFDSDIGSGRLYFKDQRARAVSEMELQDLKTKENIENINLPFLQFYYSQIFSEWEKAILDQANGGKGTIQPITRFYIPDLAKARGLSSNAGRESIEAIKNDITAFHNVVGVLKVEGRKNPSYYPVLNFEGYDAETNTISISSPYLIHVVQEIYKVSVIRHRDGTPKLKSNGTPLTKPINSYLIHSDIQKERNKAAVQNVIIIVQGIERAGDKLFWIKPGTIIERNPLLKNQLEKNQNKNRLLKRTFSKTWELLQNKTSLKETYKNIELPDPKDSAFIPRYSQLDSVVYTFKHDGKIKREKEQ